MCQPLFCLYLLSDFSVLLSSEGDTPPTTPPYDPTSCPADITQIPDELVAEPDDRVKQSEVLDQIIANTLQGATYIDAFNNEQVHTLKLSQLQMLYEGENQKVVNLLSRRNTIQIDEQYRLEVGKGQISMMTDKTMIDYHLTVADRIRLSSILPNAANSHKFTFNMELKKQYRDFKGKHAMVGFDTKGKLLYIGMAMNEDVFLAMAPNAFLSCQMDPSPPGHSTGSPLLSRRHYRQVVMMFAHFMSKIPERSWVNIHSSTYFQNLDAAEPKWWRVTNVL